MSPAGLLFPSSIPDASWEHISVDFIEGLPKARGMKLNKYAHFVELKHPFTTQLVVEAFVKEIVRLYGYPMFIANREKVYLSHFWQELFGGLGTQLCRSMAYRHSLMAKPK